MDDYPGKALTPGRSALNIGNRTVCKDLPLRQRDLPLAQHCGFPLRLPNIRSWTITMRLS